MVKGERIPWSESINSRGDGGSVSASSEERRKGTELYIQVHHLKAQSFKHQELLSLSSN